MKIQIVLPYAGQIGSEELPDLSGNLVTGLRLLQRLGILYLLQPYANNERKRLSKTPKLYFCDTGLCAFKGKPY